MDLKDMNQKRIQDLEYQQDLELDDLLLVLDESRNQTDYDQLMNQIVMGHAKGLQVLSELRIRLVLDKGYHQLSLTADDKSIIDNYLDNLEGREYHSPLAETYSKLYYASGDFSEEEITVISGITNSVTR